MKSFNPEFLKKLSERCSTSPALSGLLLFLDRVSLEVAWLLPRSVIRWAVARATAHATTGKYGSTIVPEVTALDVLRRWDTDNQTLPGTEALAGPVRAKRIVSYEATIPAREFPGIEAYHPEAADQLDKQWMDAPGSRLEPADLPKMVTLEQEKVIVIEPVSNGAVVTNQEGSKEAFVFELPCNSGTDELQGAVHLLYAISEHIGLSGSKWDKERLTIKLEHGHGYECKAKKGKCPICNEK